MRGNAWPKLADEVRLPRGGEDCAFDATDEGAIAVCRPGRGNVLVRRGRECDGEGFRFSPVSTYAMREKPASIFRRCSSRESGIIDARVFWIENSAQAVSISVRAKFSPLGAVEKPGHGSERVPFVLHSHRIDLTLSSRRRSNATEKRAFVSKGAPLRRAPDAPLLSLDTARERAYSG